MKKGKYLVLILLMLLVNTQVVNATSGALRKNSIKTCNGITYGNHSSNGVIHWHQARANADVSSGWIAVGGPIYSDPCGSSSNSSNTDNSSNNDTSSNDSSNNNSGGNSSSNNNSGSNSSTNNTPSNNNNSGTDNLNNNNGSLNDSSNNNSDGNSLNSNNSESSSSTNNTPSNNNNNSETSSSNNNSSSSNNNTSITKPNSSNSSSTNSTEEVKSNDNTLKFLIIDGKEIDVEDDIDYSTTKEKITIKAVPNDTKAKYEIKNDSILEIGENKVSIVVTAEDGTTKIYNINVKRDKILSSETGINIIINEEEVIFNNNKATVNISSSITNVEIDYFLVDEAAYAEMNELKELNYGDNLLKIKVVAEDGTEQLYEINIHKNTKAEDTISTIFAFIFLGAFGYGIYYIFKKVKKVFK